MTRVCMIVFKNDVPVLSAYFSLLFSLLPSTKRKHVAAVTILRPKKKKKKTQTRATKIIMSSSSPATENDERLREFVLWCQQRGCELNKVEIKSVDAYKVKTPKGHSIDEDAEKEFDRRVHCGERTSSSGKEEETTVAIQKGERILFIPFSCCVGTQGLRVGAGGESLPPFEQATSSERLAAELLRQRDLKEKSEFFPYINALPKVIDSPTCGMWTTEEIKEMQFADAIGTCAKTLARDSVNVETYFKKEETTATTSCRNWTKKEWAWAMANARSRAVEIDADIGDVGNNKGRMPPSGAFVAPFIDMCNHTHVDPAAFWRPAYSDKKKKEIDEAKKTEEAVSEEEKEKNKPDGVELVARRDLEPGDEITVSYAIADSDTFLLFGGFVTESRNPRDTVELWRTLPEAATWLSEKLVDAGSSEQNAMAIPFEYSKGVAYAIVEQRRQHILEAMGQNKADVNKFDWDKSGLDESVRAGWNFARDEAHHAMFSFIAQNVMPDNDNNKLYRQVLIGRITQLLEDLPTSMEEDVKIMENCASLLADTNNDNETRLKALRLKTMCRYRGQKKAILHQWLQFLTKDEMPRDLTAIKNQVKAKEETSNAADELAAML